MPRHPRALEIFEADCDLPVTFVPLVVRTDFQTHTSTTVCAIQPEPSGATRSAV
jgi:hypothetical protein